MAREYVLGFAFNIHREEVVLIHKVSPEWQAGRINGVGGKIEAGESSHEAMQREFEEETGVKLGGWDKFAIMNFPNDITGEAAIVHVFRVFDNRIADVETKTAEKVQRYSIEEVMNGQGYFIENLFHLIPLALGTEFKIAYFQQTL